MFRTDYSNMSNSWLLHLSLNISGSLNTRVRLHMKWVIITEISKEVENNNIARRNAYLRQYVSRGVRVGETGTRAGSYSGGGSSGRSWPCVCISIHFCWNKNVDIRFWRIAVLLCSSVYSLLFHTDRVIWTQKTKTVISDFRELGCFQFCPQCPALSQLRPRGNQISVELKDLRDLSWSNRQTQSSLQGNHWLETDRLWSFLSGQPRTVRISWRWRNTHRTSWGGEGLRERAILTVDGKTEGPGIEVSDHFLQHGYLHNCIIYWLYLENWPHALISISLISVFLEGLGPLY